MKVLTKYAIITILCLLNVNAIMAKETPPIAAIADAETATLSGYVKDAKSKETLVGAAVTVKGKKIGAYTNKNGFFTLKNIPAGKNTIIVSYVGYRKYEKTIDFAEKESKQLTLELNVLEGETQEVVVEADRAAELREISVSKVNIPVQQLQQLRVGGEADIFRALQFLPGVLTSSQ
ncbi:MAG: carboxypeptidase-like regulatory domain-containing protein, partial [Candidatus Kapaibacterium sp.]